MISFFSIENTTEIIDDCTEINLNLNLSIQNSRHKTWNIYYFKQRFLQQISRKYQEFPRYQQGDISYEVIFP